MAPDEVELARIVGLRSRIMNFAPAWFSVNMGTGISSVVLKNLPYKFKHLDAIANAIFVLNTVLFVIFLVMTILRYILWPSLWRAMLYHPSQSLYVGTLPMGLCTIVSMIVYTCVPAYGPRYAILAWVLWWIAAVLCLATGIIIPYIVHTRHKASFDQISGVWFFPIIGNVVCSGTGGAVAEVLPPELARITLVVSYIMWGVGVPFCFFLMPLYYARLSIYKLPPREILISVFVPIGPCGQGAFGLLQMAKVVRQLSRTPGNLIPGDMYSAAEIEVMGSAVYAASIVVALVMWGVGLFWLCNAVFTVFDTIRDHKIPFNMGWWAFTFPIGVLSSSTTSLARALDSPVFRVIGTLFSLSVVLLWMLVSTYTALGAWDGSM
ncbi:C4-dicarboxylate transporter/malic acid transport protein [Clavulina sp. PMI_390]|nr:C4-dicarboxylate transporter/malic acid transport protein [Clavulina sp. PMI_390]